MNALQLALTTRAFSHQSGPRSQRDRAMAEARMHREQSAKATREPASTAEDAGTGAPVARPAQAPANPC
jgi:hypothetical protein